MLCLLAKTSIGMAPSPSITNLEIGEYPTDQVVATAMATADEAVAGPSWRRPRRPQRRFAAAADTRLRGGEDEEEPEDGNGRSGAPISTQHLLDKLLHNEGPWGAAGNAAHFHRSLVLGAGGGETGGGEELTEAQAVTGLAPL